MARHIDHVANHEQFGFMRNRIRIKFHDFIIIRGMQRQRYFFEYDALSASNRAALLISSKACQPGAPERHRDDASHGRHERRERPAQARQAEADRDAMNGARRTEGDAE